MKKFDVPSIEEVKISASDIITNSDSCPNFQCDSKCTSHCYFNCTEKVSMG